MCDMSMGFVCDVDVLGNYCAARRIRVRGTGRQPVCSRRIAFTSAISTAFAESVG